MSSDDQYEQLWPMGSPGEAPAPPPGTVPLKSTKTKKGGSARVPKAPPSLAAGKSGKKMGSNRVKKGGAASPRSFFALPTSARSKREPKEPKEPASKATSVVSTSKPSTAGSVVDASPKGKSAETEDGGGKKKKKKKSAKSAYKSTEEAGSDADTGTGDGGKDDSRQEDPPRAPKICVPCFVFFVLLTFAGIASASFLAAHKWFGLKVIDAFTLKDVD